MRLQALVGTAFVALAAIAALPLVRAHSESAVQVEAPKLDAADASGLQTAVVAGGATIDGSPQMTAS